ncbi:MAG: hypothetical protein WBB45_19395 [Cyclobacteriaceae bacterium]
MSELREGLSLTGASSESPTRPPERAGHAQKYISSLPDNKKAATWTAFFDYMLHRIAREGSRAMNYH